MRAWAITVALLLAAGAYADPAAPAPPPAEAGAGRIAAARTEGDALIASARLQGVFDNETGDSGSAKIVLRHGASGFACVFVPGQPLNSIVAYPSEIRGDDVGCNTGGPGISITANFTRDSHADAEILAKAVASLRRRLPAATPAPAPAVVLPFAARYPQAPAPVSARFLTETTLEEVICGHVGGWLLEVRVTAPKSLANSNALDLLWYSMVASRRPAADRAAAAAAPAAPAERPAASAEEIAAARAAGERILAANHVQAMFENITKSQIVELRHRASGVDCRFDPGAFSAIIAGPSPSGPAGPDSVTCASGVSSFQNTLTVTPNGHHMGAVQALNAAVASARAVVGELSPFTGRAATIPPTSNLPAHLSLRFVGAPGPKQTFVYVGAATAGDWVVSDQVLGPAQGAMVGSVVGEVALVTAIGEIVRKAAGAPSASR